MPNADSYYKKFLADEETEILFFSRLYMSDIRATVARAERFKKIKHWPIAELNSVSLTHTYHISFWSLSITFSSMFIETLLTYRIHNAQGSDFRSEWIHRRSLHS